MAHVTNHKTIGLDGKQYQCCYPDGHLGSCFLVAVPTRNSFRITFSNNDTLTTEANGTLEEFTAYLMQDGGRTVDESPDGKETVKYIVTVEQL